MKWKSEVDDKGGKQFNFIEQRRKKNCHGKKRQKRIEIIEWNLKQLVSIYTFIHSAIHRSGEEKRRRKKNRNLTEPTQRWKKKFRCFLLGFKLQPKTTQTERISWMKIYLRKAAFIYIFYLYSSLRYLLNFKYTKSFPSSSFFFASWLASFL